MGREQIIQVFLKVFTEFSEFIEKSESTTGWSAFLCGLGYGNVTIKTDELELKCASWIYSSCWQVSEKAQNQEFCNNLVEVDQLVYHHKNQNARRVGSKSENLPRIRWPLFLINAPLPLAL